MPLEYSCFISYAHGKGKYVGPFIEALHEELSSQLEMYCEEEVFLDKDRLLPGYEYNEQLAKAICHSACMVVAYTPVYGQREYCRRELAAMELLEQKRRKLIGAAAKGHRFIIPVVFAGDIKHLPQSLKSSGHCCDISGFTLQGANIGSNPGFAEVVKPVCQGILEIRNLLSTHQLAVDAKVNCSTFALPKRESVPAWNATVAVPFPGREV